jgi:multidrug efflux system outer membrane protein
MFKPVAIFLFLGAFVAGCAVGPEYSRPTVETPATYDSRTNIWRVANPADTFPKGHWWGVFGDASLDKLEEEAQSANQQLKVAVARFQEARAQLDVSRSGYFPHIGLAPSVERQRDSANRAVNGQAEGIARTYNLFTIPLDASYEVDLWGGVRRSVEASRAGLASSSAQLETMRLSIESEVASDYFTLGALDTEMLLLKSSVEVFRKSLDLTRNRREGGIATDLDVARAETVLKTTEAQLPVIRRERLRVIHALALLTGNAASGFDLPERIIKLEPPVLPTEIPSGLLERRPDIAAAERQVAVANAKIGMAKSAFYPNIQINATAGFQSINAGSLVDWPSHLWAIGPSLRLPLFEGGALRGNLRLSKAAYDEMVAQYRQTVLSSFAEVEDNLAGQDLLSEQHLAQLSALKAAQRTLEIANNRYRAGLVTYLEVATAQNDALNLEREDVRLRGERLVTAVALVKSLGGDWRSNQH